MLARGGVANTMALGMAGSGLADGVAIEDGYDLGLLAGGGMPGLSSSTSSSLSEPPKAASSRSHSLGIGTPAIAAVK